MGKEWHEMSKEELEEGFLSGSIHAVGGQGKQALERLRILWRNEDSRMAQFAKTISWWAITIAGLTFLVTIGWLVWTVFMWFKGSSAC